MIASLVVKPLQNTMLFAVILLTSLLMISPVAAADGLPGMTAPAESDSAAPTQEAQDSGSTASAANPIQSFTHWVLVQQRSLHRSLSDTMATIDADGGWGPVWAMISLSFLYGIFHAAGPGHGKAVITTYMLTQPTLLRRGLLLSVLSSLMQGVTAIVLVLSLVFVLGRLAREAVSSVQTVEQISFALVAVLGLVIIGRVVLPRGRAWWSERQKNTLEKRSERPAFATHQAGVFFPPSGARALQRGAIFTPATDVQDPMACPTCGKPHHVAPEQVKDKTLVQSIGLVLAIGARPCAGAVLVLVVANLLGLWWAGVLAVIAMSLGTAITVATLAVMAVSARGAAQRLLQLQGNTLQRVGDSAAIIGGLILCALGMSLLMGSISMPTTRGII